MGRHPRRSQVSVLPRSVPLHQELANHQRPEAPAARAPQRCRLCRPRAPRALRRDARAPHERQRRSAPRTRGQRSRRRRRRRMPPLRRTPHGPRLRSFRGRSCGTAPASSRRHRSAPRPHRRPSRRALAQSAPLRRALPSNPHRRSDQAQERQAAQARAPQVSPPRERRAGGGGAPPIFRERQRGFVREPIPRLPRTAQDDEGVRAGCHARAQARAPPLWWHARKGGGGCPAVPDPAAKRPRRPRDLAPATAAVGGGDSHRGWVAAVRARAARRRRHSQRSKAARLCAQAQD
mmetsp:Transcript_31138/g.101470  ORF Transcript_31138/g.101470 Transcript_31138/m.101470 type:complete len:292 (-) Transcript_31138:159-1034(-)